MGVSSVTDVPVKISVYNIGQHAASETSNANSNCEVYYGDSEIKAGMKRCDASRAFDDTEMPPTTSPGGTIEHLFDKGAVKSKDEEQKCVEGRADSNSCVTGGSEGNRLASSNKSVGLRQGIDELSSPKKELTEISCSEEKNEGFRASKLPNKLSYPSSVKSVSCNPNGNDMGENLVSKEHLNLSFTKEMSSDFGPAEEAINHCVHGDGHSMAPEAARLKLEEETNVSNSVASGKFGLKLESQALTNTVTESQPKKADNSSEQNNETEVESCELARQQESNADSQHMIDSDESDVLEHDVKVCDICGDAGLEYLLAICCRCSDGAEHTYCMREMIHKVPEGDWLCEECKSLDEIKSKDAVVSVTASDKYQSSDVVSVEDTDLFLTVDRKDLDAEATKHRKNILGKRDIIEKPEEDIETPRIAKRKALGSTVESLKDTHGVASLSRDSSFKNLNKGQPKPYQSSNSETLDDLSSLRGLQHQEARRTLSKSSSFSTNPKSKVDIFSEVSQKQKVAIDKKEVVSKFIGRSKSFKPSSLSRLNHSESKVKMLSPKFSHPQDMKGVRQANAQNILERKSSIKSERQLVNARISNSTVSVSNSDEKRMHTDLFVRNDIEPKSLPSDSKPSTPSKSTSYIARKGEMNNSVPDQRLKEAGLKDDSPSGNYTADKPFSNYRGGLLGVLPQSQETDKPGERIKDSFVSRYRTNIDSPRNIVNDASARRSSADVIKGNKLKAAIEAAMLRKPGICRKNKPADQSDEVSMPSSNLNCGTRSEDQLLVPSKRREMSSAYEAHEAQASSNNGKQSSLPVGAASLKSRDSCPIVPSSLNNQPSATVPLLLKMPVLPAHDFIWQGGFDIHKIGKLADFRDGLQAHLSTCASPKVLEMANKFPSKVLLNEVPRLSTWPIQFQEAGVKEDNIALYFFAKDLESYERSYKILLETMMRRDLALKGKFDGVELLIFPSNHLPQNAKRWNMLYFLWGVFRGKKANCVQHVSDSNACSASQASDCPATMDLRVSLGDSNGQCSQGNAERQDSRVDANSVRGISVPETKGTAIPLEEHVNPKTKTKPDVGKIQPSVQGAKTNPSNARHSSSSSGISARESPSDDPVTLKRTVREEEEHTDASSVPERKMIVDRTTKEPKEWQLSHGKRPHQDPIPEALDASIISSLASTFLSEGESANKKQKTDSAVIASAGNNMFPEMVPNFGHALGGEKEAPKRGIELDLNETQDYTSDSPSPAAQQQKGGLFDLNVAQDYPPDKDEEGDGSSLLSLSLFPFSNNEPDVKPVTSMEPMLPGRPNTRSSRLLL